MSVMQPWLIFDPDGEFDGMIWSPKTLEEAQRAFARPEGRRWSTLAKEGWTVRRGVDDEHRVWTAAAIARMHRESLA